MLGSPAASVTFTSIPQGYTDLVLVADVSMSSPSGTTYLIGQVGNGSVDTGSNYSSTVLKGDGSSASSYRTSSVTYFQFDTYLTGSNRAELRASFQNYSNTTTNKTILGRTDSAATNASAIVSLWRSTSAINTLKLYDFSGNSFAAGSTFTIYGLAAASVGAKATGGTIYQDASYFYHVFSGNGTFTPTQSISADVLLVAGGGAAYNGVSTGENAGGGGAGGVLAHSAQSLSATGYTVTVGAGGSIGSNGTNSSFGGLTAAVGGGVSGVGSIAAGASGGSGGGGGNNTNGGAATSGQGFAGGNGSSNTASAYGAGGGGGAGAVGSLGTGAAGGAGGIGTSAYNTWSLATGAGELVAGTYYFAGGGGGSSNVARGAGGYGGGGQGQDSTATGHLPGKPNTGGGGGGGRANQIGGIGGSGIVIVRYAK